MLKTTKLLGTTCGLALLMAPLTVQAKVTDFTVTNTVSPMFEGQSFGDVGAYERIDGVAELAIDPNSPRGKKIVDLEHAVVAEDGLVHYSTKVSIMRPVEAGNANGTLFYEVPNRGRNLSTILLNRGGGTGVPEEAKNVGDGFLMEEGYTRVWSGWQTGLSEASISLSAPVIPGITGLSREEYVFDKGEPVITAKLSYPAADMDPANATLTVRQNANDPRSTVPGLSFKYLSATEIEITRPEGLDSGAIYEFIYTATDPVATGLGFTATADVVSFLRGSEGHDVASPVTGIDNAVALGISQSGRFLRDFIYQGFNADETGAKVFDGAIAHIAGSRKTYTNYRFSKAGRYSRQHEDHDVQGDQFPFTYPELTDPLTGSTDGILKECMSTDTCPKIMQTDTSTEFWQARAALLSTAPDGTAIEMPENVRLYFLAGAQHFTGWSSASKLTDKCQFPTNPVSEAPVMRALTTNMLNWTTQGTEPPASQFPSVSDGTLVPLSELALPDTADDTYVPVFNVLQVRDHSAVPPIAGGTYPVLVPQLDADGIPMGGVLDPRIEEPLGTYWGWNLRNDGFAEGNLCGLTGAFLPFPLEANAEDTRTPISARYTDADDYAKAVTEASEALIASGLMLEGDVGYVAERAKEDFAGLK